MDRTAGVELTDLLGNHLVDGGSCSSSSLKRQLPCFEASLFMLVVDASCFIFAAQLTTRLRPRIRPASHTW